MNAILNQLFQSSSGGTADVMLVSDGMGWGWAFFLLIVFAALIWLLYRWGAPEISKGKRGVLVALRTALIAIFLILLVRPAVMLTTNEPVRERLLVLVDTTQSMEVKDQRETSADLNRAAIAAALIRPDADVNSAPTVNTESVAQASRAHLLDLLATNDRLNLWARLLDTADLDFYQFGSTAQKVGSQVAAERDDLPQSDAVSKLFDSFTYESDVTAIGDSLLQVLDENRNQGVVGIFLLTDGANNAGVPPVEIGEIAKRDGVPVFAYGVGITGPTDLVVREVAGPRGAFVDERAEFVVRLDSTGYTGQTVLVQLTADGEVVDEQEVQIEGDGEFNAVLGYEPAEKGEVMIETSVQPLESESSTENNLASTRLRVLDNQVKVLFIEQEPRWDFRYLLSTLQRDRRLRVSSLLIDGGADLADEPDSVFVKEFPSSRAELVSNEILILGDVDPDSLGEENMELIREWVADLGGGLIFLAGPKYNPASYVGTPLEPLLPVVVEPGIAGDDLAERAREPISLKLTSAGEQSPLLRLDAEPLKNRQIWNAFPGVLRTATVSGARAGAQVLLVDASPEHPEPMPVIAQQNYGQGTVMYFGFDETYRWRSRVGEKYYSTIWNQVIQSFSLDRQLDASSQSRIQADRLEYGVGDKVVISGKLFTQAFGPVTELSVPGTLVHSQPDGDIVKSVPLVAVPDQPGQYQTEFEVSEPGEYQFSTLMDPSAVVKFQVHAAKLELTETAMDDSLLIALAEASGGIFFREEDLHRLPDQIMGRGATIASFTKIDLFYSPWWMVLLVGIACTEWFLRRLWQLK